MHYIDDESTDDEINAAAADLKMFFLNVLDKHHGF